MSNLTENIPSTDIESHTVHSENWCYTRCTEFQCDYVWTIQNIDSYICEESNVINSSTFSAGEGTCEWFLELHTPTIKHEYAKLYLETKKSELNNYGPITTKLRCSVINSEGLQPITHEKKIIFKSDSSVWFCLDNFILRSALNDSKYLCGRDLKIHCTVSYMQRKSMENISGQFNLIYTHVPSPMEDFGILFNNQELSDITVCVGNEKYPAHQLILAARSSVFKAMFTHDMTEKRLNLIVIEDIDEKTFQEVLRYIYTGKVEGIETVPFELFLAAEKYDLTGLKMMCENQLCKMLATDTAVKILSFSNTYNLPNLKTRAIPYVKMNMAKIITDSESWNELISQPDLMKSVLVA